MKHRILEMILVFIVFFTGTACIIMLDNICLETAGEGGKLVLDVEKWGIFQ